MVEGHYANLQRYPDISGMETCFLKSGIIYVLDITVVIIFSKTAFKIGQFLGVFYN